MNDQYNADDEEQVAAAQERADKRKFEREEFIRTVMSKREGRAWMNYILEFSDMFGTPVVPGDPYATHVNIGMANLGKFIWSQLEEAAPASCILMRNEARDDAKSDPINEA